MARTLKNTILHWTRALHTYLTMLALILLVFFSVTGFTLNHPKFFGLDDVTTEVNQIGKKPLPEPLLSQRGGVGTEHGYQLEAYLRQNEGACGEVDSLFDDDDRIYVQFKGAGSKMEYTISRLPPQSGEGAVATEGSSGVGEGKKGAQIEEHFEFRRTLAKLSDMHRGTGTGGWWRLLIDGTAIFLMFASLSGVILWISMPKRRTLGIIALVASVVICLGCWLFLLA